MGERSGGVKSALGDELLKRAQNGKET